MSRVLTPCLPWKSCLICESRLFPKAASPEKRSSKFLHQAAQYGRFAVDAVDDGDAELAYGMARAAGRFVTMAEQVRVKHAA